MDIGKEDEEATELPIPVDPRKIQRETPVTPSVPATPVKEPARQHVESFQEWLEEGIDGTYTIDGVTYIMEHKS